MRLQPYRLGPCVPHPRQDLCFSLIAFYRQDSLLVEGESVRYQDLILTNEKVEKFRMVSIRGRTTKRKNSGVAMRGERPLARPTVVQSPATCRPSLQDLLERFTGRIHRRPDITPRVGQRKETGFKLRRW